MGRVSKTSRQAAVRSIVAMTVSDDKTYLTTARGLKVRWTGEEMEYLCGVCEEAVTGPAIFYSDDGELAIAVCTKCLWEDMQKKGFIRIV